MLRIFISIVFLCSTLLLNAQDLTTMEGMGEFNVKVNNQISTSELLYHHITMNRGGGNWKGVAGYNESISFYFELENNIERLRKVIVSSTAAGRTSYTDYLLNDQGELVLCMHSPNTGGAANNIFRYYFVGTKIIAISDTEATIQAEELTTEDVTVGVEFIKVADKYKAAFAAIRQLESLPKE